MQKLKLEGFWELERTKSTKYLRGCVCKRHFNPELCDNCLTHSGGCAIGTRPIDIHLMAFKDLGAEFICTDHPSENSFPVDGLEGDSLLQDRLALLHAKCKSFYDNNKIILRFPSVGATENILLYSAFSGRKVDLYNAAREPEIIDLQQYLNKIGANITGAGTSHITIFAKNYNQLKDAHSIDCSHTIIPDRIEGGTYILACAVCGGSIKLKNTNCRELGALLRLINGTGDSLTDNEITFKFKKRPSINE